jgi:hypothetical protein
VETGCGSGPRLPGARAGQAGSIQVRSVLWSHRRGATGGSAYVRASMGPDASTGFGHGAHGSLSTGRQRWRRVLMAVMQEETPLGPTDPALVEVAVCDLASPADWSYWFLASNRSGAEPDRRGAAELNEPPRETLGWMTPSKEFSELVTTAAWAGRCRANFRKITTGCFAELAEVYRRAREQRTNAGGPGSLRRAAPHGSYYVSRARDKRLLPKTSRGRRDA